MRCDTNARGVEMNSRGFVFTLDAIIALILVVSVFTISLGMMSFKPAHPSESYEQLHYLAQDSMTALDESTILDQIGNFWATGNCSSPNDNSYCLQAKELADAHLSKILPKNVGYRLRFGNYIITTSGSSRPDINNSGIVAIGSRILSGKETGKPVEGYVARAYLTKIISKETSAYAYFGGYVGEGNISRKIELPSDFQANNITLELDVISNFTLYINGNYAGHYNFTNKTGFTPVSFNVSKDYLSYLTTGNNTFLIDFDNENLSTNNIRGGFIRVNYNTSELSQPIKNNTKFYFPGIDGFINIYSSFYVPGNITGMKLHMHYLSNNSVYLTIGNETIFNSSSPTETTEEILNSTLSTILNYTRVSDKTLPIRIGTSGVTYVTNISGNADSFLVTDVSGSMADCVNGSYHRVSSCTPDPPVCCKRLLIWTYKCDACKLGLAKEADMQFVDAVLNASGNQVGLVSYESSVDKYHSLSTNESSLDNEIYNYDANGGTCICCGVNKAHEELLDESSQDRNRSMIVMTDGNANYNCSEQGTGDAAEDAILAAHQACADGIAVYTVGFGSDANETTLKAMACGGGSYYNASNVSELLDIYNQIAQEIVSLGYKKQTAVLPANLTRAVLYNDSYIEFNYTPVVYPLNFGEISIVKQTNKFGGNIEIPYKWGSFEVPNGTTVINARVTSYSSDSWTDRVNLSNSAGWDLVYWLNDSGSDYQRLGDPFIVNIPAQLIANGTNYIGVGTGLSPENATGGSPADRIIYELRFRGEVPYGDIFFNQTSAVEDAIKRLNESLANKGIQISSSDIIVENNTASKIPSLWGPSRLTLEVWQK